MRRLLLVLTIVGLLSSWAPNATSSPGRLPELSFPPSIEITEVSPDLIKNGMPMRIYGFRSHRRIEDVMVEMGLYLEERDFLVGKVMSLGELQTLGISDDRHFINVQGQRSEFGQGSAGFVVITPRPDLFEPEMSIPTVPLPNSVEVLSHEFYRDGPRAGEAVLGVSVQRAVDVGNALVAGFEGEGWEPAPDEVKVASKDMAVYRVLRKGERLCRLIAMDQTIDGRVMATVNINCHN